MATKPISAEDVARAEAQKEYIANYLNDQKNSTHMAFFEADVGGVKSKQLDPMTAWVVEKIIGSGGREAGVCVVPRNEYGAPWTSEPSIEPLNML